MKKLLLLFALIGILSIPAVSAFTSAQFAAKKCWRTIRVSVEYIGGQNVPMLLEGDVTVSNSSQSPNPLIFDEFLKGCGIPELEDCYFYGTVSGNSVTMAGTRGEYNLAVNGTDSWGYAQCYVLKSAAIKNANGYWYFIVPRSVNSRNGSLSYKNSYFTGTANTVDGNYSISFEPFTVYKCQATSGYIDQYEYDSSWNGSAYANYYKIINKWTFGGLTFQTYDSNATATDTKSTLSDNLTKSNSIERSYGVNVKISGEQIHIENWNNMGHPFDVGINGGNLVGQQQNFDGIFNHNTLEISMKNRTVAGKTDDYYDEIYFLKMGSNFPKHIGIYDDIHGSVDVTSVAHQGTNLWLNKLDNKTYIYKPTLKFDDYQLIYDGEVGYLGHSYVENTKIKLNEDLDFTHNLSLTKNLYGYNAETGQIYLNVDLNDFKNSAFVKEYQLYIVPGNISMPDYSHADFGDTDNGHVNGVRIDTYTTDFVHESLGGSQKAAATGEKVNFNLLFDESKLGDNANNGTYSLYVKAIYTEDSNLAPSFHALTPLNQATTGVTNLVVDTDAPAVFFNMNGVQVDGDNMAPGVYIKKQGNKTSKVVIR